MNNTKTHSSSSNAKNHTPTPWGFAQTYNGEFSICSSRERVANHVATVPVFNGMSHSGASVPHEASAAEANAAFIVRACNAHDELVAALKFAKESIVQNRTLDEARNDRALNEAMVAIENRISRALAKAGAV